MEKLNITPPIIPFPPVEGGGVFGKVIKAVKWLFGLFKKPSKEVGESDSNDSLENIERITTIFIDFKEQVHAKAVEIEQAIQEEIGYYVEELHDILSYNDEKVLMYDIHINRISRQIDRISLRVEGVIDNELSKSISLDNFECREIMKMIPGSKKETAMEQFFQKAIYSALNTCCTEMQLSLDEIYEDVENEVVGAIETIKKQIKQLQDKFSLIDEDDYQEAAKKQITNAFYLNDVCDQIIELL